MPSEVNGYHSLYPLSSTEPSQKKPHPLLHHHTSFYRATRTLDGSLSLLVRLHTLPLTHNTLQQPLLTQRLDPWISLTYEMAGNGIVGVKDAFTTSAWGDESIVVVYDYVAGSRTMEEWLDLFDRQALNPASSMTGSPAKSLTSPPIPWPASKTDTHQQQQQQTGVQPRFIPEELLWSFAVQLIAAIKTVHDAGLALCTIAPSGILVTTHERLLLNFAGLLDVMRAGNDPAYNVIQAQVRLLQSSLSLMIMIVM